jgi:hypothetical protein
VDVQYRVEWDRVKEEIVVRSKPASWSFPFLVSGTTLSPRPDGGLDLGGSLAGKWWIMPPVVVDRNGVPIEAASPRLVVGADGHTVTATVDADWASSLTAADYPITYDPAPAQLGGSQSKSYGSYGGNTDATHTPSAVRVGRDTLNATGQGTNLFWRTHVYFDYAYNGCYLANAAILPK